MILGLLLAITLSVSLAALGIIITGLTGALKENLATGAVIGTAQAVSYASITLSIALLATLLLVFTIRNKSKKF